MNHTQNSPKRRQEKQLCARRKHWNHMQVTDRPRPDAPSLTQTIIVQMVYWNLRRDQKFCGQRPTRRNLYNCNLMYRQRRIRGTVILHRFSGQIKIGLQCGRIQVCWLYDVSLCACPPQVSRALRFYFCTKRWLMLPGLNRFFPSGRFSSRFPQN